MRVPSTSRKRANHCGWAGQAGAVTLWPLTKTVEPAPLPDWAVPDAYEGAESAKSVLARDLGHSPITLKLAITSYVIGLGVFYTLTSWASLAGYSSSNAAISKAQTDAANFFFTPSTQYAGHWVTSVMSYLIITGSFACGMAFHNTTARYLYSLGREGLAPRALGRTHPKWKSPHIASITQSFIAAAQSLMRSRNLRASRSRR